MPFGPGTVLLKSANATSSQPSLGGYSGTTTLAAGTLLLGNASALPESPLNIGPAAVLDLNGFDQTTGTLTSSGAIDNSAPGPVTLTVLSSASIGALGNTGGDLNLLIMNAQVGLNGPNTYTGTTTVEHGSLSFSLGSAPPPQTHVLLASSNLGASAASTAPSASINGISVAAGASTITQVNSSGVTPTLNFGALTRDVGGTLNFDRSSGNDGPTATQVTNTNLPSGILGGWATVSVGPTVDWASVSNGYVNALPAASYAANTFAPGANTDVISSFTATNTSTGSIRFATYANCTLTLTGLSVVETGGILVGQNLFEKNAVITGGSITSGNGSDLIVINRDQPYTTQGFTILSPIVDNGTTPIALTKSGGGTLVLGGANTFSGPVYLNEGSLILNSPDALPAMATIYFNGGTLENSSANAVDYTPHFSQSPDQFYAFDTHGQNTTFSTPLTSQGGSFTKYGAGTLTLAVPNTYDGPTTVIKGTLLFGASNAIAGGDVEVNGATAVLDLNGNSLTAGVVTISGGGTITGGTITSTASIQAYSGTANVVLAGDGIPLVKTNSGTVSLNNSNTCTGGTSLVGGVLLLNSPGALGPSGPISFAGGLLRFSASNTVDYSSRFSTQPGQLFKIDTNGQTVTFASPFTGASMTNFGAGTLVLAGAVDITGPTNASAGLLEFSGNVTHSIGPLTIGAGGVAVDPGTTLVSAGVNATSTGTWSIAGTDQIQPDLGSAGTSVLSAVPTFIGSGQLDLTDNVLIAKSTGATGNKASLLSSIQTLIAQAHNSGPWTGSGITSSTVANDAATQASHPWKTTLALFDNAAFQVPFTTFGGQTVDANSLLVTRALVADGNLDNTVNNADLVILLTHYGLDGQTQSTGDYDGNGTVDNADLVALLTNYGQSLPTGDSLTPATDSAFPPTHAPTTPVPEPTSLAAILPATLLLRRKRHRTQIS